MQVARPGAQHAILQANRLRIRIRLPRVGFGLGLRREDGWVACGLGRAAFGWSLHYATLQCLGAGFAGVGRR